MQQSLKVVGIFKFKKSIMALENNNLRPPYGWVHGQGILSVLDSQACNQDCSGSEVDALKQQHGKHLQICSESEGGWNGIHSIKTYFCWLLSTSKQFLWLEAMIMHEKEEQFFQDSVESCLLENLTKAMNAFQRKDGLVNKQNDHSNL